MAKRLEPAKNPEINSTKDLISKLPDEVLTHILSFVPTTTSVRTSVLSKRWYRLWISVPNLDFFEGRLDGMVRQACIENIIDRFLSLHNVMSVRRIKLDCEGDHEISRVSAWIAALGERDAEKCDLILPRLCLLTGTDVNPPICSLPDNFYIQRSLVKLKLTTVVLKVPQLVCFPNLKKIVLKSVQFFDETSVKNLLDGSPVLSTLLMFLDEWNNNTLQRLHICSSSLCDLAIHIKRLEDSDYAISIDSPNLSYLSIKDYGCSTYNMINVSSLVTAHISIEEDEKRLFKLLTQISHVEDLVLCYFSLSHLPRTSLQMGMFPNLIDLTLEVDFEKSWEVLPHLFRCTPNLVSLCLREAGCSNSCAWCEPYEVPECFLSSIQTVRIEWLGEEDEGQMQFISYVLKNAMVLKKLSIGRWLCDAGSVQENKFRTTLSTLPKCSTKCQVEYTLH